MTQLIINVGNVANDGQGTPLRTAFEYINNNFTELYSVGTATAIANGTSNVTVVSANGNITTSVNGTSNVVVFASTGVYVTGLISASGNITAGNLDAVNLVINSISSDDSSFVTIEDGVNVNGEITATGNISGGNLTISGNTATITTANYSIGYLNVPQVSLSSNITTALVDSGKHYYSVSASNLALTIANNTSVAWPVGTSFIVVNRGSANVTVAPGSGVSLYLAGNVTSANRTITTYGLATCLNLDANVWIISGSGLV
jgi:hypothetical protein